MCLAIPFKIISIKNKKIIIEKSGQKKEVKGSLIKTKIGDYVILQNNFIVKKINKKTAGEIINLIQNKKIKYE